MNKVLEGKNLVLFWRLEEKAAQGAGSMMMFQTEHSVEKSRDSDSIATKSGNIRKPGALEEEVPFKSIVAVGDPVVDMLHEAINGAKLLEQWEINVTGEAKEGKYPAVYRQGYLTELNTTANAEDEVEIEGTFATNMLAQKGEATVTKAQLEAIQYQFADITQKSV